MKLYLSSYRLGNNPERLTELFGENKKVAVIVNAMDFLTSIEERKQVVQMEIDDLKNIGLDGEETDLRGYFGKPHELQLRLQEYGGLWVRGGNVFILQRAFKESGMDKWLQNQKDNKKFVYAGYSAGVCVLSSTLKGLDLVDNPNNAPKGYKQEFDWNGLGLINYSVAPHYMSQHPEAEAVNRLVEYFKGNSIEYITLSDGDVVIEEI